MELRELETRGKGAEKSIADSRLITIERYADVFGAPLIDWNAHDILALRPAWHKIEDQGASLSCVGQSTSSYAEDMEHAEGVRGGDPSHFVDLSARDLYAAIRLPWGGARAVDALKRLTTRGVAPETVVRSYDAGNPPTEAYMASTDGLDAATNAAYPYRAKSYAAASGMSIQSGALAVASGEGAVFGFTGSNEGVLENPSGIIRPPKPGEKTWGHLVHAIADGYGTINGKLFIKFKNSWGDQWGDHGYGYIGEDYFAAGLVFDFLTAVDLPDAWLDAVHTMLRTIIVGGLKDQYIDTPTGWHVIPDSSTLDYLASLGLVPFTPTPITDAEFKTKPVIDRFPSKLLTDTLEPIARDIYLSNTGA